MPRSRVTYVPERGARRPSRPRCTTSASRFDETLRVGEDVDLVWRLRDAGLAHPLRAVRPGARTANPRRGRSCCRGGSGTARRPARSPGGIRTRSRRSCCIPWPTLTVAAALARRPLVAAGVAGIGRRHWHGRCARPTSRPTGLLPAMADAVRQTWLGLGRYLTQFAAPALLAALCIATRPLSPLPRCCSARRSPPGRRVRVLDPVRFTLGSLADEIAYGAGVWVGSVRARTLRASPSGRRAGGRFASTPAGADHDAQRLVRDRCRGAAPRAASGCPSRCTARWSPGSERGRTIQDNLAAFAELGFAPHTAGQPADRDLATTVHGPADLDAGAHLADRRAGRPSGRRGRRRARRRRPRHAMGLSSFASKPVEEVVAANPQTFFQVYWVGSKEQIARRLERARSGRRGRRDRDARLVVLDGSRLGQPAHPRADHAARRRCGSRPRRSRIRAGSRPICAPDTSPI